MGFFNRERRERPRAASEAAIHAQEPQQAYSIYTIHPTRSQTVPDITGLGGPLPKRLTRPVKTILSSTSLPMPQPWHQPVIPDSWIDPTFLDNQMVLHNDMKQIQDDVDQEAIDFQLSQLLTMIDEGIYAGTDKDLVIDLPSPESLPDEMITSTRSLDRSLARFDIPNTKAPNRTISNQPRTRNRSINILSKVSYYSNSRLPPDLPPLRVYMPTWPLFCLAAQYSSSAYDQPASITDHATHIAANPRLGTKAMIAKDVCLDDRKVIVFAIRGTSVFSRKDWDVNLSTKPSSPAGFLDDDGNLCHSGFLKVAKAMIQPIAIRLRTLLEQNPSRSGCSLIITGHSAGGAVASLIYSHMMSERIQSDLTNLTSCFRRVHCITFGSPPISLLPLTKPESRSKKSLFHSFINEGDPVARAEPIYFKSLIDLILKPIPSSSTTTPARKRPQCQITDINTRTNILCASLSKLDLSILPNTCKQSSSSSTNQLRHKQRFNLSNDNNNYSTSNLPTSTQSPSQPQFIPSQSLPLQSNPNPNSKPKLTWPLPPSTLSNAGRLIILRVPPSPVPPSSSFSLSQSHEFKTVTATIASDDQIRQVIFGDPTVHSMDVYRRRIEALSFRAVTGR